MDQFLRGRIWLVDQAVRIPRRRNFAKESWGSGNALRAKTTMNADYALPVAPTILKRGKSSNLSRRIANTRLRLLLAPFVPHAYRV
jgi:hypothetical protein